jgi:hypothetical protein
MSWLWGGGSKKGEDPKEDSSSFSPETSNSFGSSGGDFSAPSQSFSAPSAGVSAGGGMGSFKEEVMAAQQNAMIQSVMLKLTDLAFEECVKKPSSSLSYSERACIKAVSTKYSDTSVFVVQNVMKGNQGGYP